MKLLLNIERNAVIGTNFNGANMRNERKNDKEKVIMNEKIRSSEVRLIDDEGVNHGIVSTNDALKMAYAKDLDLVVMNATQAPPVAKIMNYGKFRYEQEKKAKEAKKKQHTVEVKEVKIRYKIDTHDYQVRIKNIQKFIAQGNKVKIAIMLRGREMQHTDLAFELAQRLSGFTADRGHILKGSLYFKNNSYFISSGFLTSLSTRSLYEDKSLNERAQYI